jgi:hypothetical protein
MKQIEKSSVEAGDSVAQIAANPEKSPAHEIGVPPEIRKAIEKHRSDLAELMKVHEYRWAAYRGSVRLEIGKSKRLLYLKYLERGITLDELVVLGIGPQIPEEIDVEDLSNA